MTQDHQITDPATNTGKVFYTLVINGNPATKEFGSFKGGIGTTPLEITLNANATAGLVTLLLRDITFANVSDNPSTNPRTLSVQLSDGDGGTSAAMNKQINVI